MGIRRQGFPHPQDPIPVNWKSFDPYKRRSRPIYSTSLAHSSGVDSDSDTLFVDIYRNWHETQPIHTLAEDLEEETNEWIARHDPEILVSESEESDEFYVPLRPRNTEWENQIPLIQYTERGRGRCIDIYNFDTGPIEAKMLLIHYANFPWEETLEELHDLVYRKWDWAVNNRESVNVSVYERWTTITEQIHCIIITFKEPRNFDKHSLCQHFHPSAMFPGYPNM
jgi:hypothetical protein